MRIISMVVAGLFLCPYFFAQDSQAYKACSSNAQSTFEILKCVDEEAKRVDKELNDDYLALLERAKSDPIATRKFKAAERAWIAYRDAFIAAMYTAEDKQATYGSIYPIEALQLSTRLTRQQIDAVKELRKNYEDTLAVRE